VYQPPHLLLGQTVAGHHLQEQCLVVVGNVAQVRGQAVELVVALALHGFATRQAEPLLDYFRIGYPLKCRDVPRCVRFGRIGGIGGIVRMGCIGGGIRGGIIVGIGRTMVRPYRGNGGGEQSLFIEVEHIPLGHHERRAGIVLHAGVVVAVAQLRGHPPLGRGQIHPCGDDEQQAQALGAGRDVCQDDAQLGFTTAHLRVVVGARVVDVVHVVHRQAAGDGVGVQPPSVLERGVRGDDGKHLLAGGLQGFEVVLRHFAPAHGLEGVFYLSADTGHEGRIECLAEQLGGALAHHTALYVIAYSEFHFLRS